MRYDRFARSLTERLRVRPVPGYPFWVLSVRNPVHHTHYQVCLPEYPLEEARFCSCEDFVRRGIGTCKHVEAASGWLASHPALPAPTVRSGSYASLWRAVDAARQASVHSSGPAAIRLREPGRVLFERRRPATGKKGGGRGSESPPTGSGA